MTKKKVNYVSMISTTPSWAIC